MHFLSFPPVRVNGHRSLDAARPGGVILLVLALLLVLLPSPTAEAAGPLSSRLGVVLTGRFDAAERTGMVSAVVSPPSFSANAASPTLPVTFTAGCTDDAPCGGTVKVAWDFGDGSRSTSDRFQTAHAYTTPGVYTARVQVSTAQGVGQGSIQVLVSPRWADADADLLNKTGRTDREAVWVVSALGLLPSCRTAFPYLDPSVDPASTDVNRGLFCPEPSTTFAPNMTPDATGTRPDIMPAPASSNGLTGVNCMTSWDACGLPASTFAQGGSPRSSCNAACRSALQSTGLVRSDLRLTYDPLNCLDGWKAIRQNNAWAIAAGVEAGCVTRGEFYRALVKTVDGPSRPVGRLVPENFCPDNSAATLGATEMRRAAALDLPVLRTRNGGSVCETTSAVTKEEAYVAIAQATGLAPNCLSSLRDLQDRNLGSGASSANPACAQVGAILAQGAPLVGDSECADGVGACFQGEDSLSRSDLVQLLAGLVVGTPSLSSGLQVSLTPGTNPVKVGSPTRLTLSVTAPRSYPAGSVVTARWPAVQEGLSSLSCPPTMPMTLNAERRASITCDYVRTQPGTSALVASVQDERSNTMSATAVVTANNSAPVVNVAPLPSVEEDTAGSVVVSVSDAENQALTYSLRSFVPGSPDPGTFSQTNQRATLSWSNSANVATGSVSVEAAPGGAKLTFAPGAHAYGDYTVALQACDPSVCTVQSLSGVISPKNDAPVSQGVLNTGAASAERTVTLRGSDPSDAGRPGYAAAGAVGMYEISGLPAQGTVRYDADPGSGTNYIVAVAGSTTNNPVIRYTPPAGGFTGVQTLSYRTMDTGYPAPGLWSAPGSVTFSAP